MTWSVFFSKGAVKQYERLKYSGQKKPSIIDIIDLFVMEMRLKGPERRDWPNFGKLLKGNYHCHLKKGHPTYVICWEVVDEKKRQIEVCYVGTHEGAPY